MAQGQRRDRAMKKAEPKKTWIAVVSKLSAEPPAFATMAEAIKYGESIGVGDVIVAQIVKRGKVTPNVEWRDA